MEATLKDVTFGETLRLRVDHDLKQRLRAVARANRRKTSDWVREQLWKAVQADEEHLKSDQPRKV